MPTAVYHGFIATAAWWMSLVLLRIKPGRIAVQAVLTGLLCGISRWLCGARIDSFLLPLIDAGIFLLSGLTGLVGTNHSFGDIAVALLLSWSAYAASCIPALTLAQVPWGGVACVLLLGMQTMWIRRHFPTWSCTLSDKEPAVAHQTLLLAASLCVLLISASLLFHPATISDSVMLSMLCSCLWGAALWLMALLDAYAKECAAVQSEQQYRDEMRSFLNVIRSQRHDYNFHVQTISELLRQGKLDDCLRYMDALEEDASIMNAILPVRDPAISAMLHAFRIQAVRQGIEMHINICYDLSQIATNVYETNKIISNLLQNAVDEVSRHEDKSFGVELTIFKRGEYCVIRVSNQILKALSGEELNEIFRQGYTSKQGHEGVGLSSLRTLAARYHGTVYAQLEGDIIHFIARIPINYAKEPYEEER